MAFTPLDIESLISQMTLEEKASLCSGSDFWHTQAIERLGIPAMMVTDGPHGLRKQAAGGDQLGIGNSEPATCFPTAAALASTWDRDLVREVGAAVGDEALAQQVGVVLGPGVNIKRSPLCGRNFEYFSEDPALAGELGAALVQGIQSQGVGTSVKHFAANNQETDRLRVSAEVDERTLREIYFAAFERIVTQAAPWTIMCSYNKINGTYASQDPWLLTEVLRDQWGFDGLVVSDWGAVDDRVQGVAAGLDLEMPTSNGTGDAKIAAAVKAGDLDEKIVDEACRRLLALLNRAMPALDAAVDATFDADAHHALARRAAAAGTVLLRNEGDYLPLDPDGDGTVAVIGAFAVEPRYQGAGSSQVNPTTLDVALEQIRRASGTRNVGYAAGFSLENDEADDELIAEATALAKDASAIVLCCGLPARIESEGFDRANMDLPAGQLALIDAIAGLGKPFAVVLVNGSVVSLEPWCEQAAAIVECWLGGQAGGGGLADVLFGVAEPGGRLAETIPMRLEDNPSYLNFPGGEGRVRYGEGIFVGYRWYDAKRIAVRYPFGHGLGYTTFDIGGLGVAVNDGAAGQVTVRATVTNTGAREGSEVVQLYVGSRGAAVPRPVRELKGFVKVHLAPGQTQKVEFALNKRDFAYFCETLGEWRYEAGTYVIEVGASLADIRGRAEVDLPGDGVRPELTVQSTIGEVMADPAGAALMQQFLGAASGPVAAMSASPEMFEMMASIPLVRAARMAGMELDDTMLHALLSAKPAT